MAKQEKAEPKQVPRSLIITQCAFRRNTVPETRQYLQEAGHDSKGKIANELTKRTKELESAGILPRVRVPLPNNGELRKLLFDRRDLDKAIEAWKERSHYV